MEHSIICAWSTYKGSHCKRLIHRGDEGQKFCELHANLISEYTRIKSDEVDLCETFKDIKLVPRNQRHVKYVMTSLGYEDEETVQVYLAGGSVEEADITNYEYIILNSDNTCFYYNVRKGQNKAKDLKIMLREFCKNDALIKFGETRYCEDCYRKTLKDAPRISLIE